MRSDWQAIDLLQIADLLRSHDLVFAEVFYTFGPLLSRLASERGFTTYSVFLLPVDKNPYTEREAIISLMREKLERRGTDTAKKIEERAQSAPTEMQAACQFSHRLLNPASEDNIKEWGEFGTCKGVKGSRTIHSIEELGADAQWLVKTFVEIAKGNLRPGDYRR